MDDCLLFCIHEPRFIEDAKAFKKVFGIPVVSFTLWEYAETEHVVSEYKRLNLGKLYSLPAFYFKHIDEVQSLDLDEVDARQVALEERLGIENNTMVVSYERAFLELSDYRDVRNLQLINLMFVDLLLSENNPRLFFGCREAYIRNLLADACLYRGIPAISTMCVSGEEDRLGGFDSQGRLLGMPEAFEALQRGETFSFDASVLEGADRTFETFVAKPKRPQYAETYSRSLANQVKAVLTKAPKAIYDNIKMYNANEYDRAAGGLESSWECMARWPRKAARMAYLEHSDFFVKKPDLTKKFIYLPLHFAPEVTDMYFGKDYSHHEGFVMNLAKRIPSEYVLYVKDHTSMLGSRSLSWYNRLKKQYNVELIHPYVSTFDLIRNSSAVLTVTGTAGWEAYLLGKPVIVLGQVFYNCLPGLLYAGMYEEDFVVKVRNYLSDFKTDYEERRNAVRAVHAATSQLGPDGDQTMYIRRVTEHAELILGIYEKWGDWLLENEPAALRGRAMK